MAGPDTVPAFLVLGEAWASTSGPLHSRQLLPPLDAVVAGQPCKCYMWRDGCRPQEQVEHILRAVANCLHDRALQRWDPTSAALVPLGQDPILALQYPLGGDQCMVLSADKISKSSVIHQPEKGGYAVINLALTEEIGPAEMGEATRCTRAGHHYCIDDGGTRMALKVIGVHRFVCWAFNGMPPLPSAEEMAAWGEAPRDREAGWLRFMQEVQCMHLCNNPDCIHPRHMVFGSMEDNRRR